MSTPDHGRLISGKGAFTLLLGSRSKLVSQLNYISEAMKKLDEWIQKNGWSGYDPYDVKGTPIFLVSTRSNPFIREISHPLHVFDQLFPRVIRLFLGVRKTVNAKAMALFARGYAKLYESFKEESYMNKALACLSWLEENSCKGFSGYCWGYPFSWASGGGVLFPRDTPSGVVSSIAGHAFLDAYELLEEKKYLKIAESVCVFIVNDLNKRLNNNEICFSYTPLDNYEVLNANLWCASLLARASSYSGNGLFEKMAAGATKFVVREQRENGAWHYWSTPYADRRNIRNDNTIDNYHTGFVLECLIDCDKHIQRFDVQKNIRKGAIFFMKNLLYEQGFPKMQPDRVYPIDVHSCAQTIITFSKLSEINLKYLNVSKKVALWAIRNMQDRDGFFYYRMHRWRVDKTPYIRWGQAWMLKALSNVLFQISSRLDDEF